jgi:hypothetical protein
MTSTDDVDFVDRVAPTLPYLLQDILHRQFKGERIACFFSEGTETTAVYTNVGIIDVLIHDIIHCVSVKAGSDFMSQGPDRNDILAVKKLQAVFQTETLAILNLSIDMSQTKALIKSVIKHRGDMLHTLQAAARQRVLQ